MSQMLFELFKEVVLSIGPQNVVHIVTDNAANYVAAGKLLEKEFPTLVWSPCAAHCINLMLQDIGKLTEVSEVVSCASDVTKYIYNHCYALYLMRVHTGGREILRPAPTRFATNFIALQSILAQKDALRAMVTSKEWRMSAYAKEAKGKQFVDQVLDSTFWNKCVDIVKVTEPLVRVLRMVDSEEKPAMGFLYQAINMARAEMVKRFQRNKKKVEPYLKILDDRWDSQLRKNLHAAGYWLNPACRYNQNSSDKGTISGLFDVIDKYSHGNQVLRRKLTAQVAMYKDDIGDFGRPGAMDDQFILRPDVWWDMYATDAPELQTLAIRILSQTCSASGCERNWSVFEHIHSKKRNRLEHQKLNDLVFVRYNLRLQDRRKRNHGYDPINVETIGDYSRWVIEDSPPLLTNEELNALRGDLASMTVQPIETGDLDQLHLDDEGDNANANAVDNPMENENENNDGGDGASGDPSDEEMRYDDDVLIASYNDDD